MQGGLGLHVHVLSQPISPAQSSFDAQSAFDVHVFPPLDEPSCEAVEAGASVGAVAASAPAAEAGAVALVAGSDDEGGGLDAHASALRTQREAPRTVSLLFMAGRSASRATVVNRARAIATRRLTLAARTSCGGA